MSERGRGRRGGSPATGGRGAGGRTPPSGGRGRGLPSSPGGRGRGAYPTGGSPGFNAPPMYQHQQPSMAVSSITREVDQKLSLQPSSSANPPARPQPVQQSSPPAQPPVAPILVHQAGPSTSVQPPKPPPASSKHIGVPPRPGYGTVGRKCIVRANHFLVEIADRDLHHYDVSKHP